MILADLQPDVALKALLDGKVQAKSASGKMVTLKVFADGEHGNKDADDEYIEILYNGNPDDKEVWSGNLALYLRCKLQNDTKAKTSRIRLILRQIEPLVEKKHSQGYFFWFDKPRYITPVQRDYSTGYSSTVISMKWKEIR